MFYNLIYAIYYITPNKRINTERQHNSWLMAPQLKQHINKSLKEGVLILPIHKIFIEILNLTVDCMILLDRLSVKLKLYVGLVGASSHTSVIVTHLVQRLISIPFQFLLFVFWTGNSLKLRLYVGRG